MKFSSEMGHFLKGKKKLPKLLEILRDEKKDDSFWRKFRLLLFFLICSVPYEPTTFNLLCISKYYYFYVKTFSKVTHSDKSVEILSRKYFFQTNEKNWYFCGYFSLLNDCSLYFWRIKKCIAYHYFWDNDYLLKNFISQSIWRKIFHKTLLWNIPCVYTLWIGKKMWNTVIRNIFIQNFLWISMIEFCFATNCLKDDFFTFLARSMRKRFCSSFDFWYLHT